MLTELQTECAQILYEIYRPFLEIGLILAFAGPSLVLFLWGMVGLQLASDTLIAEAFRSTMKHASFFYRSCLAAPRTSLIVLGSMLLLSPILGPLVLFYVLSEAVAMLYTVLMTPDKAHRFVLDRLNDAYIQLESFWLEHIWVHKQIIMMSAGLALGVYISGILIATLLFNAPWMLQGLAIGQGLQWSLGMLYQSLVLTVYSLSWALAHTCALMTSGTVSLISALPAGSTLLECAMMVLPTIPQLLMMAVAMTIHSFEWVPQGITYLLEWARVMRDDTGFSSPLFYGAQDEMSFKKETLSFEQSMPTLWHNAEQSRLLQFEREAQEKSVSPLDGTVLEHKQRYQAGLAG